VLYRVDNAVVSNTNSKKAEGTADLLNT
jgi:hypothetical protein